MLQITRNILEFVAFINRTLNEVGVRRLEKFLADEILSIFWIFLGLKVETIVP